MAKNHGISCQNCGELFLPKNLTTLRTHMVSILSFQICMPISQDSGSPAERGIMRSKILCVSEVIGSTLSSSSYKGIGSLGFFRFTHLKIHMEHNREGWIIFLFKCVIFSGSLLIFHGKNTITPRGVDNNTLPSLG